MEKHRLEKIEQTIFSFFASRNHSKVLTKEIFDNLTEFANADLVRAFEDLEKSRRLLVRYTDEGHDWILLTPEGAEFAGVGPPGKSAQAIPHPPKSRTAPPHV